MDVTDYCTPQVLSKEQVVDDSADDLDEHQCENDKTEDRVVYIQLRKWVSRRSRLILKSSMVLKLTTLYFLARWIPVPTARVYINVANTWIVTCIQMAFLESIKRSRIEPSGKNRAHARTAVTA